MRDLLNPGSVDQVRIRETTRKGVWMEGVSAVCVASQPVGSCVVGKELFLLLLCCVILIRRFSGVLVPCLWEVDEAHMTFIFFSFLLPPGT